MIPLFQSKSVANITNQSQYFAPELGTISESFLNLHSKQGEKISLSWHGMWHLFTIRNSYLSFPTLPPALNVHQISAIGHLSSWVFIFRFSIIHVKPNQSLCSSSSPYSHLHFSINDMPFSLSSRLNNSEFPDLHMSLCSPLPKFCQYPLLSLSSFQCLSDLSMLPGQWQCPFRPWIAWLQRGRRAVWKMSLKQWSPSHPPAKGNFLFWTPRLCASFGQILFSTHLRDSKTVPTGFRVCIVVSSQLHDFMNHPSFSLPHFLFSLPSFLSSDICGAPIVCQAEVSTFIK